MRKWIIMLAGKQLLRDNLKLGFNSERHDDPDLVSNALRIEWQLRNGCDSGRLQWSAVN